MGSSPCVCVSVYKFPSFYKDTRHTSFMAQSNQVWSQLILIISPCCLVAKSYLTLCNTMDCSTPAPLSATISWSLLKFMSIKSVIPSSHLKFCYPLLLLPCLSQHQGFFPNKLALRIKQPKYWSFSNSPSNEYSGWFPLELIGLISLQFKGLSNLLQHHNLKASVLQHSNFFMVQVLHPYMTPGKTIALTR